MKWLNLLLVPLAGLAAAAAQPMFDHGPVFTIVEENDLVVETDRHYTQGIKLSYFHADGFLPLGSGLVYDALPQVGFQSVVGRVGYAVGQNIYTPAEITPRIVPPGERPYAGWLYLSAILQRRGWSLGERLTQESFELDAGVIGPWALAGEAQIWVHEIRGFTLPRGWRHQLKNEPGVRLKYSRAVRLFEWQRGAFGLDFTPRAGVSLGNVDTSARLGGMVRLGYNLPDDFGYHIIDSLTTTSGGLSRAQPVRWSAHLFAATEGRAVAFNQFLDGNIFHHSPSVDKELFVADSVIGFVIGANHLEFGYAHTLRSPEFRGQTEHDTYGSVFLKVRF